MLLVTFYLYMCHLLLYCKQLIESTWICPPFYFVFALFWFLVVSFFCGGGSGIWVFILCVWSVLLIIFIFLCLLIISEFFHLPRLRCYNGGVWALLNNIGLIWILFALEFWNLRHVNVYFTIKRNWIFNNNTNIKNKKIKKTISKTITDSFTLKKPKHYHNSWKNYIGVLLWKVIKMTTEVYITNMRIKSWSIKTTVSSFYNRAVMYMEIDNTCNHY